MFKGDRVGLSADLYRGPINGNNPVWDSHLGRIAGTVVTTTTNDHNPENHRVLVRWDGNQASDAPSEYREDELFILTPMEIGIAEAWVNRHVEDTRDLVFLAHLPDQMFRIAFSFHLTPRDIAALGGEVDATHLLITHDGPVDLSSDGRLLSDLSEEPRNLLGFPMGTNYASFFRACSMWRLPMPRALPRIIYDMPSIYAVMNAVPEKYDRALAVFTLSRHNRNDVTASIFDVLNAYADHREHLSAAEAMFAQVREQAAAEI